MRMVRPVSFAAALTVACLAQAGPLTPQSLPQLVKKADFLVVGQVVKIADVGEEQSEAYKMPVIHKRATIRVNRAIKSADATVAEFGEVTVDYLGVKADADGAGVGVTPSFPRLAEKQIGVFPIKRVENGWRFVDEEDVGMIAPAALTEISAGWPADVDGNVAFIYRELAGACLYGDFVNMARVGRYLDSLGDGQTNTDAGMARQPSDYIFALMKAEVGESLLREDTRWFTVGTAAYVASAAPRPSLDAIINGMAAEGGGAARAPTDGLPRRGSLRLAALAFTKCSHAGIAERILMLLVAHQEDEPVRWGIAKALVDNFSDGPLTPTMNGNVPMLITMEEQEFRRCRPGALYVADYMVKDDTHPLAAAAVAGARAGIAADGDLREMPRDVAYTPALRAAEGLILRAGNDDDFAAMLNVIRGVKLGNAHFYEALLSLAGDSELSPPKRVLEICRQYIDDDTAMRFPTYPGFRLCDLAALTAARIGKQDFGMVPNDPVEKRNAAVARAAMWLKPVEKPKP